MSDDVLRDPIQQLDLAVVDQDLLWRVEVMNAARPLYADDFADVVAVADRVHPDDVTVVVLGPRVPDTTAAALAELLDDHPGLRVVAVEGAVPAGGMPGVDLVVPADTSQEALVATAGDVLADLRIEHDLAVPVAEEQIPAPALMEAVRIVVVTSAKGGEGASTVAANLAVDLAEAPAGRVAVVDTDAVFGDLGLMFDVPVASVGLGVDVEDLGDPAVADRLITRDPASGVDVVVPPRPADPLAVLTGPALQALLATVAVDHDVIVVDARPALIADAGLAAIADLVLVVATPRLPSLKNAAILAPTLVQLAGDRPDVVGLVLNRAEHRDHDLRQIGAAVRAPVLAAVPSDRGLADGVDRHVPGALSHPHSAGARALRQLAGSVIDRLGPIGWRDDRGDAPPSAPEGRPGDQVAR